MSTELTATDLINLADALRRQILITERRIERLTEHTPQSASLPGLRQRKINQHALLVKVGRVIRGE